MSSNFVPFKTVDNHNKLSDELLFIRAEDVVRIAPSSIEGCSILYMRKNTGHHLWINSIDYMYQVQGKTTEVHERLFGKRTESQYESEEDRIERLRALFEANTKLKRENEEMMEMNKRLARDLDEERAKSVSQGQRINKLVEEVKGLYKESELLRNTLYLAQKNLSAAGQRNVKYIRENQLFRDQLKTMKELEEELAMVRNMHAGQHTIIERMQQEAREHACAPVGDRNNSAHWKQSYDVLLKQSESLSSEVRTLRERNKYLEESSKKYEARIDHLETALKEVRAITSLGMLH